MSKSFFPVACILNLFVVVINIAVFQASALVTEQVFPVLNE
jgi:hypothetical protein